MIQLKGYRPTGFTRGVPVWIEVAWIVTQAIFFLPPIPWPSALRTMLLRAFGARIGTGFVIRSGVNITFPWRFEAGDDVWIGNEALILTLAPVVLGSSVCISQRAFLCTGSHDYRRSTFDLIVKPIRISDGTWIAAQAFVGPGVNIGAGAVIAAGTVLGRDVPPGMIVRGNPAGEPRPIDRELEQRPPVT